jgi:hypothetical protein
MEVCPETEVFQVLCRTCGIGSLIEAATKDEAEGIFSRQHGSCQTMNIRTVAETNPVFAGVAEQNGVNCPVCGFHLDEDYLIRT